MARLLVIDPLDLTLENARGVAVWSSRQCLEEAFRGVHELELETTGASDKDICRKAADADGVVLGGSEASAWEDSVFNDHLLDLIAICRLNEIPLLAICYGAQLLGRALGAHVARHPEGIELGAPAIRLTAKGKEHFLFKGIEETCIKSIETHQDAVLTLPLDCELLASTAHTPVQAFSFRDLLTGVQFHPEMSADDLRSLWDGFVRNGIIDGIPEDCRRLLVSCECGALTQVTRNFGAHVAARARAKLAL